MAIPAFIISDSNREPAVLNSKFGVSVSAKREADIVGICKLTDQKSAKKAARNKAVQWDEYIYAYPGECRFSLKDSQGQTEGKESLDRRQHAKPTVAIRIEIMRMTVGTLTTVILARKS